jgi:hypothetical protein
MLQLGQLNLYKYLQFNYDVYNFFIKSFFIASSNCWLALKQESGKKIFFSEPCLHVNEGST